MSKRAVPLKKAKTPKRDEVVLTPRNKGRARLHAVGEDMASVLNSFAAIVHLLNDQWWCDPKTGRRIKRNKPEMIALMHSELSEALEAVRKDAKDDKLPQRLGEEVEMADTVIRILDYCAGHKLDLGGAIVEKLWFNVHRADHQPKSRLKPGGKKF